MRSNKHDKYVWVLLGLVVIALCFFASCRTGDQYRAAAASTELSYGTMMNGELSNSKRDFQTEGSWFAVGIHPFAYWDMQMRAEATARAIVEQRYAERPPPPPPKPDQKPILPVPKPNCEKPK